jgi:hypothetical protein
MRLLALLFTATLTASPLWAQPAPASPPPTDASAKQDKTATKEPGDLPVSLDKIREALEHPPAISLRSIDERPTFRMEILERRKIEELLATLNFKTGPAPGGGLYGYEMQRQMFPAVDNPLRQPYAAFGQLELLTILLQNLVGKYLGGKAINAISKAERARAEANARAEVRAAVEQYCNAQPNLGAGIQICSSVGR